MPLVYIVIYIHMFLMLAVGFSSFWCHFIDLFKKLVQLKKTEIDGRIQ